MKTPWLGVVLIGVIALPALGQNKEQDRVENAGKVAQEIMNIPDDIPQSVIDKADCVVVLPSVVKFAIGIGGSYGRGVMPRWQRLPRSLGCSHHDGTRGW